MAHTTPVALARTSDDQLPLHDGEKWSLTCATCAEVTRRATAKRVRRAHEAHIESCVAAPAPERADSSTVPPCEMTIRGRTGQWQLACACDWNTDGYFRLHSDAVERALVHLRERADSSMSFNHDIIDEPDAATIAHETLAQEVVDLEELRRLLNNATSRKSRARKAAREATTLSKHIAATTREKRAQDEIDRLHALRDGTSC